MITKPLFRKNYIIFASIVLVFIVVAISASWILTSFERDRMFMGPAAMNQTLLKAFDEDPFKAIVKLNDFSKKSGLEGHDLVDAQGISLLSGKKVLPRSLSADQLSQLQKESMISLGKQSFPAPPLVISKTNKDGVFLYSRIGPPGRKPPIGPFVTLLALITCVLISIGVALFYQFSKYRERSVEALAVLSALREGNLSARLPQKKFDELSPLIEAFNQMAGDLELMVDQLRKADTTRRQLLQDLAHDLRTPLTSLRTFLETLQISGQKLSEEKRQEVLSLCFSEVQYFGKLVEDLLFLAQITEPKYSLGTERIDLRDKVTEQLIVFKERSPHIRYDVVTRGNNFEIMGSSKLLDRLLRNAFENSSSFTKSKISVEISESENQISVSLLDDGPGFTAKALSEFGHKKASRVLIGDSEGQRISVGIGSVIMKEIAQLHSGTLSAENIYSDNLVVGAKVSVSFKKS
ncbi:histidine kinase dimerization/phospho-acceptor domain-containing protein [Bdellovibrio bacteriovorus]|uniref:histidine kinase dimerization/phospho-acceptor domain-containing protein n=1 Tax=Bdellovibrio bacteriovorus TaxID=959 RepID=UPI0035A835EA